MPNKEKKVNTIIEYKYFKVIQPLEVYGSLSITSFNVGDSILCKIKSTKSNGLVKYIGDTEFNNADYLQKTLVGKSTSGKDIYSNVISIPKEIQDKIKIREVEQTESWIHPAFITNEGDSKNVFKGWGTIGLSDNSKLEFISNAKQVSFRNQNKIVQCK